MTVQTKSREPSRAVRTSTARHAPEGSGSSADKQVGEPAATPNLHGVLQGLAADAAIAQIQLIESPTPEAVHTFRRVLRRLRAVIRLIEGDLPPGDGRYLARELRWMTAQLGAVRDLDVLEARLRTETEYTGQTIDEDVLVGLVVDDRAQAVEQALEAAKSARALSLFAGLSAWLCGQAAQMIATAAFVEHIPDHLRSQDTAILKAGADISHLRRAERHRLRSKIKALRYALEALPWLYPAASPYPAALAALHTLLGDMNDDAVARRLVRRVRKSHALEGPSHHRGPSKAERKTALGEAWTQFQEDDVAWLYDEHVVEGSYARRRAH
jgi:CHAD domain-containing protein